MLEDQLDLLITDDESPGLDQLRHDLSFVAATVAQIAASLPVQRRPLTPFVRMLHCRVVWLRRNGLCPACQEAEVCNEEGKPPGAEFDHWMNRYRNEPEATWIVCGPCNRALEDVRFKATMRSQFESYQNALRPFLSTQREMFH